LQTAVADTATDPAHWTMGTSVFNPSPLPYSSLVEQIPADESEDIERLIAVMRKMLARTQARTGEFRRDVHVKSHGCAVGEFHVLPDLPDQLAQGLFAQPRTYPVVVRFSNSAPQPQPDAVPDGRGLAIQVQNVSGESLLTEASELRQQNFVMVNHPTFVARNVKDYLRLEEARLDSNPLKTVGRAIARGAWNPFRWPWRGALTVAGIAVQAPAHPASYTYYSMVPIRFGNWVAKYRARPAGDVSSLSMGTSVVTHSEAMRLALVETLRTHAATFNVEIQLRTLDQAMPIEDATVGWPEADSPYCPVAKIVLAPQDITLPAVQACENLSFSVWHALAAHQPLGGINRLRRRAYEVSSAWRTSARNVAR